MKKIIEVSHKPDRKVKAFQSSYILWANFAYTNMSVSSGVILEAAFVITNASYQEVFASVGTIDKDTFADLENLRPDLENAYDQSGLLDAICENNMDSRKLAFKAAYEVIQSLSFGEWQTSIEDDDLRSSMLVSGDLKSATERDVHIKVRLGGFSPHADVKHIYAKFPEYATILDSRLVDSHTVELVLLNAGVQSSKARNLYMYRPIEVCRRAIDVCKKFNRLVQTDVG